MRFHKIEVDNEVWDFLKKHAEPFEDTPNSVLKRILLRENKENRYSNTNTIKKDVVLNFPPGTPNALSQILEVLYEIKKMGRTRTEATKIVAKRRNTFPQTIIDKYCRQLGKKAYEIDRLLHEQNLKSFKSILEEKFRNYKDVIDSFFNELLNSTVKKTAISDGSAEGRKVRNPEMEVILKESLGNIIKRDLNEESYEKKDSQLVFPHSGKKFLCKYSRFERDHSKWFWGVSQKYWANWSSKDYLALIMENEDDQGFSYLLLDSKESLELFKRCSESNGEKKINMRIYVGGGGVRIQEWQEFDIRSRIKPIQLDYKK